MQFAQPVLPITKEMTMEIVDVEFKTFEYPVLGHDARPERMEAHRKAMKELAKLRHEGWTIVSITPQRWTEINGWYEVIDMHVLLSH